MRQKIREGPPVSFICKLLLLIKVSIIASRAIEYQADFRISSPDFGYRPTRFFQNSDRCFTAAFLASSVPNTP